MNKKNIMFHICLMLCISMLLIGCGTKEKNIKSDKESETEQQESLEIIQDGEYKTEVTLTGGTGRASVDSPAKVVVKDGKAYATIVWSSPNYDYMIVDGEKYLSESNPGEKSEFTIPILEFGKDFLVIGDTVAMSVPHEIEYKINFKPISDER